MKKTIAKYILFILILTVIAMSLSSCGECTEHTFDNGCDTSCNNEGCDFIRETQHVYDHDCDSECNVCGQTRETSHVYDNECDGDCSVPGCGATRPTEHKFDHGCDGECNVCGQTRETKHIYAHDCDKECKVTGCGYVRETQHVFDNDCDESCNTARCGYVRETEHKYDSACDSECNVCGFDRTVKHEFDNVCDTVCNVEGCGYEREVSHLFDHECDSECNTEGCGYTRETQHVYDHDCDKKCNVEGCGYVRETEHKYDNACDGICNVIGCGATRPIEHKYDHACDVDCNECGYERRVNHLYSHGCDTDCNTAECDFVRTVEHIYAHSLDKDCETPECSATREIGKQAILLMGQSNMVGFGDLTTVAPISDPRLSMMRGDKWVTFMEPLYTNSTSAGIGLAGSFSKAFVETFDVELGVIPAAVGGTSLEKWAVGGSLYNEAVRLCKIAQQDSEICAILWHQGEGNQDDPDYAVKFRAILDAMLEELGLDKNKIVIVTGELFGNRSDNVHKAQLEKLKEYYTNYGIAESDGLTVFDVTTHFDSPSLRVFGYRYFNVFYNLLTGGTYTFDDDPLSYYIAPDENAKVRAEMNFDEYPLGDIYSAKGVIAAAAQQGSIKVVEETPTDKYVTIKNGFKTDEGKYGSAFIDIFGKCPVGAVVTFEGKFRLSAGLVSDTDLFKPMDTNNNTYFGIRLTSDGKLYSVLTGTSNKEYLGKDLSSKKWTHIKVVMDFENNLKDIYVDDELVLDNAIIKTDLPKDIEIIKCRVGQFINNQAIGGSLDFDDYRCSISDAPLGEKPDNAISKFDFNNMPLGTAENESNVISHAPFDGRIEVVESEEGNRFLSLSNGLQTNGSNNYSSCFTDIVGASPVGQTMSVTAKFKLGENFAGSAQLLKLMDQTNITYYTLKVEPDGKLYMMTDKKLVDLNYSLSEKDWTELTVVFNLKENRKVIYINGSMVASDILTENSTAPANMRKVRIAHFQQIATGGTIYVDDYRFAPYEE